MRCMYFSCCASRRDDELDCGILDEDPLLDALETEVAAGGVLLEYHSAEMFPERWIDSVWVTHTENSVLYARLLDRGYSGISCFGFYLGSNISS